MLDTLNELQKTTEQVDSFCEQAVHLIHDSNPKYDWVGIYLAQKEILHLPPTYFKGMDPEHKDIPYSEGICGAAATQRSTVVVDDVNSDPRYLACSIFTKSEIVVPLTYNDALLGVLDLDSHTHAAFGVAEQRELESAAGIIAEFIAEHSKE